MRTLRLVLGDQLSLDLSSLQSVDVRNDLIWMCEVWDEATYVKHHKKKIAFLFSAMRHFAKDLKDQGYPVHYTKLDDPQNAGSFRGEIERAIKAHRPDKIIVTHPGESRVLEDVRTWEQTFGIPVEILDDTRFLCPLDDFKAWAKDRKTFRMEFFYRDMRRRYNILMNGENPEGGEWNYDAQNRQSAPDHLFIPKPKIFTPDMITQDVMALVANKFSDHFGDLEPFYFAVTRAQALEVLDAFIDERLESFGEYQDAMVTGEPWMYHSHLSFYLNCGLLNPLEVIQKAEQAYRQKKAPLNAVEGFIRQILGWREYVRGIYWLKMPAYAEENYLGASRNLPSFFWTAETKMNCLKQSITETKSNAYAHHIQRLMVLGNFCLLAGIDPRFVNEWYLIVYADAYEWVEMPNVSGMVLFADGGLLASKPYAASGAYIDKMSDYCKGCTYNVKEKNGAKACPFNYLYWDFLDRNRGKLGKNQRLAISYKSLDKMDDEKRKAIQADAKAFFESLL
jgi:deoxyribodipyrimidine photolyase-related protein